jgi:hypothetical protein
MGRSIERDPFGVELLVDGMTLSRSYLYHQHADRCRDREVISNRLEIDPEVAGGA